MKLKDLLYGVSIESIWGPTDRLVSEVNFDSRKVTKGDLFVAIHGTQTDGHDFIAKAINAGALSIVCQRIPDEPLDGVTYVEVTDSQLALAIIASNYFDHPSKELKLVGVTGTNGKTTVCSLLYQLFTQAGFPCGLLSTVEVKIAGETFPATHTTPDPIQINRCLRDMAAKGVGYCFMEVSSHGIHQKRNAGLHFAGGVFTNLTHDHLDYHGTFEAYRDVKKSFFDSLPANSFALINKDDRNGPYMLQNTKAKKYSYGLHSVADFKGQILENHLSGLFMRIRNKEVWSRLVGTFNSYNLLAIFASAELLGLDEAEILSGISRLESVRGRFQYFKSKEGITSIVDYAHTPDALKNILETINDIRTKNETLITVVGCGGDRDKTKRPKMALIAASLSDKVLFTSDNPRSEDPEEIIKQMEEGVPPQLKKKTLAITNRRQAIQAACSMATSGDIILVAGKGHETYQEIMGKRTHFDDMIELKSHLEIAHS